MLKKLKRRFVRINMLLLGAVILFIYASICTATYRQEKAEIDRTLEKLLTFQQTASLAEMPGEEPVPEILPDTRNSFHGQRPQLGQNEPMPYVYAYSVFVSPDGTVQSSTEYGGGMEEETLTRAVAQVLAAENEKGSLSSLRLVYASKTLPGGTVIAFASTDHLFTSLKNTALVSGGVCAAALILLYFISRMLAGYAMRPVERAWEQQKRFVADASHDLKTPLTVILANMDILTGHREQSVESQMQWVRSTADEAGYMRGLAEQMLELAKSETPSENTVLTETDISEISERVALQMEPVAFDSGVKLDCRIAAGVRLMSAEQPYVRLVHILLDNAIKYSEGDRPVSLCLTADRGGAVLTVTNYGNPIPPQDLPHIFDRFYRADGARTVGGHGLGLAIAKNLAASLGGRMTAESTPEGGTVFTVTFRA